MNRTNISFSAKISPVKSINDEFTLCKCYVMATGKNRNLSFISEEAVKNAMPSLFNIPVIGHMYEDDDGELKMGGHDMEIVQNSEGNYVFKSMCVPYGVVPYQDDIKFEDVLEPNGDIHKYLVCDVILWTSRYPELKEAIYDSNIYFGQSMEINVDGYEPLEDDKNYTNIIEYTYSALCLLGKSDNPDEHVEPCFPASRVETYAYSIDDKFAETMNEMKKELSLCFSDNRKKGGVDMDTAKDLIEGQFEGEKIEEDTKEAVETPNVDAIPQDDAEDTREVESSADETLPEGADTEGEEDSPKEDTGSDFSTNTSEESELNDDAGDKSPCADFATEKFSTYREKYASICSMFQDDRITDENGNQVGYVYYYVKDFDDEFAFVEKETTIYDPYKCERHAYKVGYVYDEDSKISNINGDFTEIFPCWLTKEEISDLEKMKSDYRILVEYKNNKELEARNQEIDSAMSEFEDMNSIEEFNKVYENRYEYASIEELKTACYAIRGKYGIVSSKKKIEEPIIPIAEKAHTELLYGGFFEKYLNK